MRLLDRITSSFLGHTIPPIAILDLNTSVKNGDFTGNKLWVRYETGIKLGFTHVENPDAPNDYAMKHIRKGIGEFIFGATRKELYNLMTKLYDNGVMSTDIREALSAIEETMQ